MSSNNPQLNYLVFDDDNEELHQNHIQVKIPGFTCNVIFINPNDFYNPEDDTFNLDDFRQRITDETKGNQIHLVASDWNMLSPTSNHPEVNGLEIIEILLSLNEKYRKVQYLVYSGKAKEASDVLISKIKQEIAIETEEPIYTRHILSLLIELKIKFCSRNVRFGEIISLLKEEKTVSAIVLSLLENFESTTVVNTGNSQYDGRTIGSLIDLVYEDNDKGLKFIHEFIELSIANYTELNVE